MTASIAWPDPARQIAFDDWLQHVATAHRLIPGSLRAASADASFRRYFRIDMLGLDRTERDAGSCIIMDAPPLKEDVRPFIDMAARIERAGLNAPRVLAEDVERGFLLLSDLGDELYLHALQSAASAGDTRTCDRLMRAALAVLLQWQQRVDATNLPDYDDALLRRELDLFPTWCVERECGVQWRDDERREWNEACDALVASALAQPTLAVHRDYMPRNLMVCDPESGSPGLLDFQDAVRGPISYDLASLLRDAFISWDEAEELDWAVRYWQAARDAELPVPEDFGDFWRQIEWMGLQRHLKVLGIFCRLKHRDGKPGYSADLPRFFAYAHKVSARYNALRPLSRLLEPLMGATRMEVFG